MVSVASSCTISLHSFSLGLMVYIQDLVSYERTLTAMTGEYQIGKPDYDATSTDDENADKPFASSKNDFLLTKSFTKFL